MLPHSQPWITGEDEAAVARQLRSGALVRGARVRELESETARYVGLSHALATASGTAAITVALEGLGIGEGDEVIVPTYVCASVSTAVQRAGGRVVLCDVGAHWNMTTDSVGAVLTERTKAIIVVHIFGIAADTSRFLQFGLPVIDDYAQALGAPAAASAATVACFSFHATKCLTTGEGGLVATNDAALMQRILAAATAHRETTAMTDLQAALGASQLQRYGAILERRRVIAARYFDRLPRELTASLSAVASSSMFFRFPLRFAAPFDAVRDAFAARGIAVRRGVDALLHREAGLPDDAFPHAVEAFEQTVSIPILPQMSDEDVERVIAGVNEVWRMFAPPPATGATADLPRREVQP